MHTGRLFEILYYLQAHGSATARQLAQRFEVSERTIRRDVDALSAAGVPVYTRPGRTGGVALLEGYRLDTALLSEAEQTEVLAGLRGLAAKAPPPRWASFLARWPIPATGWRWIFCPGAWRPRKSPYSKR